MTTTTGLRKNSNPPVSVDGVLFTAQQNSKPAAR
jgi:hypothetical protein